MSNLFRKAIVFTDIHFGLKSNSLLHNQDCSRFVDWIIKTGQENIFSSVQRVVSELEEIKYLQRKVLEWLQTPEKSAQTKEKLFRAIHQTLTKARRQHPEEFRLLHGVRRWRDQPEAMRSSIQLRRTPVSSERWSPPIGRAATLPVIRKR